MCTAQCHCARAGGTTFRPNSMHVSVWRMRWDYCACISVCVQPKLKYVSFAILLQGCFKHRPNIFYTARNVWKILKFISQYLWIFHVISVTINIQMFTRTHTVGDIEIECEANTARAQQYIRGLFVKYPALWISRKRGAWPWCNLAASQRRHYCAFVNTHSPVGLVSRQWDAVDWACILCDCRIHKSPPFQRRFLPLGNARSRREPNLGCRDDRPG